MALSLEASQNAPVNVPAFEICLLQAIVMEPEVSRWRANLHDVLYKPASSLVETALEAGTRQTDCSPQIRRRVEDQHASVQIQSNRCWSGSDNNSRGRAWPGRHRKGHSQEKAEVSDPKAICESNMGSVEVILCGAPLRQMSSQTGFLMQSGVYQLLSDPWGLLKLANWAHWHQGL